MFLALPRLLIALLAQLETTLIVVIGHVEHALPIVLLALPMGPALLAHLPTI